MSEEKEFFTEQENIQNQIDEQEPHEAPEEEVFEEVQENQEVFKSAVFENFNFGPVVNVEKQSIKKMANASGWSFLLMSGIVFIINIIVMAIFEGIRLITGNESLLNDPAVLQAFQIILSSFAFTVPFAFIYKLYGLRISDLVIFKKPNKKSFLPLFVLGLSFCSFANIASSYAGSIFESIGIEYNVDFGEYPKGIFGFLLSFISIVIVPALVEEFACRGIVMGSLRKFGDGFAIVTSSIIFGLMHGNFVQIPFAFLVGLILGFVTVKSGSLWVAVAVHASNNFISLAMEYFFSDVSTNIQNLVYIFYITVTLFLGIVVILCLNDREFYKLESSEFKCSEKEKYKWFFTSVPIIIFCAITILEALAFFII